MTYSNEVVAQAAQVAFEAARGFGHTLGEVDLPTWQIAPMEIKARWIAGTRCALEGGNQVAVWAHMGIAKENLTQRFTCTLLMQICRLWELRAAPVK